MRYWDYKRKYDPDHGRYVYKHVYGEGMFDSIQNFGRKLLGKTVKKTMIDVTKKAATAALDKSAKKTGEFVGNRAGDKIVELLRRKNGVSDENSVPNKKPSTTKTNPLTEYEINERVNQLLSGGRLRK